MYPSSPSIAALREVGVPAYREIEVAAAALARLAQAGEARPRGVPPLPPAAAPVVGHGYFEARDLLAGAGVPFAEARRVVSSDEAIAAAAAIGFPVALKALGLMHKSDAGGVVLGIGSAAELERALDELAARLAPPAFSVERTAPVADGVELIVGCRRDPRFGPIVLVGLGGIFAEFLSDVAVALAPAEPDELEELLRALRGAALLEGARGRPPVDVPAAAGAAAALSRVAAEHPEIAEIEINPLLVTADGALGLDARIVPGGEEVGDAA
jgi:acyl-CoA synthetase (NDP forming)